MKKEKARWVGKTWGGEFIIVNSPQYCGKVLYCMKGLRASIHFHNVKDEMFYVSSGKIKVYYSDELNKLQEILSDEQKVQEIKKEPGTYLDYVVLDQGSIFHVPPKRVHCIEAIENSEIFEISTQHFEEDSIRLLKFD
ncbi:MAG: cupin domain-containing protein [Nanoarchaeota archaeon]